MKKTNKSDGLESSNEKVLKRKINAFTQAMLMGRDVIEVMEEFEMTS